MVSLWRQNGNLQQYIEKNPKVERYPLVRIHNRLSAVHIVNGTQCIQVAKGVAYLHGIGMASLPPYSLVFSRFLNKHQQVHGDLKAVSTYPATGRALLD